MKNRDTLGAARLLLKEGVNPEHHSVRDRYSSSKTNSEVLEQMSSLTKSEKSFGVAVFSDFSKAG